MGSVESTSGGIQMRLRWYAWVAIYFGLPLAAVIFIYALTR